MMPDDGRSISRNVAENIMIQDMINSENSMIKVTRHDFGENF